MLLRITLLLPLFLFSSFGMVLLFHPNDARLPDDLELAANGPGRPVPASRQFSALHGDLSLAHGSSGPSAVEALRKWEKSWPAENEAFDVRVQSGSARFSNPAQVRVSLGVYPGRVEARDGIFVPAGGSLVAKLPDGSSGVVKSGIAAIPGDAAFDARVTGAGSFSWRDDSTFIQRTIRAAGAVAPAATRAVLKFYMQFMRPRSAADHLTGSRWIDFSLDVPDTGSGTREIELSCKGASPCVFADVRYFPEDSRRSGASMRPENFVVVMIDTLRADGVLGDSAPAAFRDFNREAAVFSSAMSPGNMTSPSTNALLSCHTPTEIRDIAFAYAVSAQDREAWYRQGVMSFPGIFAKGGYHSAMIGNISVISEVIGVGVNHGFSENISIETEGYETPLAAREAARWIRVNKNSPFVLYVHLNAPHGPYKAPLADVWQTWPGLSALGSMASALKWLYSAEVNHAAHAFQRILEAIESEGLRDTTNVILLADHGDQHAGRRFHGNESGPVYEGAFFDHGATLLTDEVGVPFSWRGPGISPAVHRRPVSTIGAGPAMLQKAGLDVRLCGESSRATGAMVAKHLSGEGDVAVVPFGIEGYQQRAVVFDGRWKYVRAHEPTVKKMIPVRGWSMFPADVFVREELYDLEADPAEKKNLASEGAPTDGIIARARKEYERFYKVTTGFELVIEAPHGELVQVPGLGHEVSGQKRVVIALPSGFSLRDLKVLVAGNAVAIDSMAWRLPLRAKHWPVLPREVRGEGALLPVSHEPNAYLRRVPVNDTEVRRIVSGNPMFDQILREWGYLHDD